MKYLVFGLGNPGVEYALTRHNIGFVILDALHQKLSPESEFATHRYASVCRCKSRGRQLVLIKPTTFMNLSGKAVRYWVQQECVPKERILVVLDDIALPFGLIRVRGSGGSGGHNGLEDIVNLLGTEGIPRLRFGIGSDFKRGKQSDYVLSRWNEDEERMLKGATDRCAEAILSFASRGLAATMEAFNSRD